MCSNHLPDLYFLFQMWHPQINTQRLIPVLGKGVDLQEIILGFCQSTMLLSFVPADHLVTNKLEVMEEML